jgi:hypothetical protein
MEDSYRLVGFAALPGLMPLSWMKRGPAGDEAWTNLPFLCVNGHCGDLVIDLNRTSKQMQAGGVGPQSYFSGGVVGGGLR